MPRNHRIGFIVPSSNTTMETEVPALLRRREQGAPETFTFHSSRMPMRQVSPEELARMDAESDRCALELSDARCDALAYACLVAIMAAGPKYHLQAQRRLAQTAAENGGAAPVITSAGALVDGILALGARRVALVAPYLEAADPAGDQLPGRLRYRGCGFDQPRGRGQSGGRAARSDASTRDRAAARSSASGCAGALGVCPDAVAAGDPAGRGSFRPAGPVGGNGARPIRCSRRSGSRRPFLAPGASSPWGLPVR